MDTVIKIKLVILLIVVLTLNSCISNLNLVDYDDLYFREQNRNYSVRRNLSYDNFIYSPYGYWNDWGWNRPLYYNQPRTIIVVPKIQETPNYGKRPSREGSGSTYPNSNSRRGRN